MVKSTLALFSLFPILLQFACSPAPPRAVLTGDWLLVNQATDGTYSPREPRQTARIDVQAGTWVSEVAGEIYTKSFTILKEESNWIRIRVSPPSRTGGDTWLVTVIDQDHLSVYYPGVLGTHFQRIR